MENNALHGPPSFAGAGNGCQAPQKRLLVECQFVAVYPVAYTQMQDGRCAFTGLPALGDFADGVAVVLPGEPERENQPSVKENAGLNGLIDRGAHEPRYTRLMSSCQYSLEGLIQR